MTIRKSRRSAILGALALCAVLLPLDPAHSQGGPQSTWEPDVQISSSASDGRAVQTFSTTESADECRKFCIAATECVAWQWRTPNAPGAKLCFLIRNPNLQRMSAPPGTVISGVVTRPSGTPSRAVPASLFPQPKPGSRVLYSLGSSPQRYVEYRFLGNEGNTTLVDRYAWQGTVTDRDRAQPDNARMIFDEVVGGCTVTASPAALRTLTIGSTISYTRRCATTRAARHAADTSTSTSVAQVQRIVKGREIVTMGQGTFEGVLVEKRSRTTYRAHVPGRPELSIEEVSEFSSATVWVESCGCFLRQSTQSRLVSRNVSATLLKALDDSGPDGALNANVLRQKLGPAFEWRTQIWVPIQFY